MTDVRKELQTHETSLHTNTTLHKQTTHDGIYLFSNGLTYILDVLSIHLAERVMVISPASCNDYFRSHINFSCIVRAELPKGVERRHDELVICRSTSWVPTVVK